MDTGSLSEALWYIIHCYAIVWKDLFQLHFWMKSECAVEIVAFAGIHMFMVSETTAVAFLQLCVEKHLGSHKAFAWRWNCVSNIRGKPRG